jgi:hypothetical protein
VTLDGAWIDDRFIDHLYTLLENACNDSAIACLQNSLMTAANTKYSPACSGVNSCSLATASNSGYSSASHPQVLLVQQISHSRIFLIPLSWPGILVIEPRGGPKRKHHPQEFLYCCRPFVDSPVA